MGLLTSEKRQISVDPRLASRYKWLDCSSASEHRQYIAQGYLRGRAAWLLDDLEMFATADTLGYLGGSSQACIVSMSVSAEAKEWPGHGVWIVHRCYSGYAAAAHDPVK